MITIGSCLKDSPADLPSQPLCLRPIRDNHLHPKAKAPSRSIEESIGVQSQGQRLLGGVLRVRVDVDVPLDIPAVVAVQAMD